MVAPHTRKHIRHLLRAAEQLRAAYALRFYPPTTTSQLSQMQRLQEQLQTLIGQLKRRTRCQHNDLDLAKARLDRRILASISDYAGSAQRWQQRI